MPGRKVAFSGKKKRDQLMQKRQRKAQSKNVKEDNDVEENVDCASECDNPLKETLMVQPEPSGRTGTQNRKLNRYNLSFFQESKAEMEKIKLESFQPFDIKESIVREIDSSCFQGYDFPIRPKWHYNMTKETLDRNEIKYFRRYVERMRNKQKAENKDLSLFELNLETWRQLWRVLEISDILLIIVDVRYAALMFPPYLYDYIINTIKKQAILVLNKVDLVEAEIVVAWMHYFKNTYPGMPVALFASNPKQNKKCSKEERQKIYKRSIEGVYNIFKECKNIVQSDVDLSEWEKKILDDMSVDVNNFDSELETIIGKTIEEDTSTMPHETIGECRQRYHNGILTLGCIGFPNVGKSSLINALKGRKVVSVSRTPGHTKHFQTIFLTKSVKLCDCPGLVFPSSTSKYLQVLIGSYPISQLRVPYRSIRIMAENMDVQKILKLRLPYEYDEWSPVAIAESWAIKRGYIAAKAARADTSRAANQLLRCCVGGHLQLILQFYPPQYHKYRENWLKHPDIIKVKTYQDSPEDVSDISTDITLHEFNMSESSNGNTSTSEDEDDDDNGDLRLRSACSASNAYALLDDEP